MGMMKRSVEDKVDEILYREGLSHPKDHKEYIKIWQQACKELESEWKSKENGSEQIDDE